MKNLTIGQRYMSLAEPELGLGLLTNFTDRTIQIKFNAVEEVRNYGLHSAPIRRVRFEIGDEIADHDGEKLVVETVTTDENGLIRYVSDQGEEFSEILISDKINFVKPEQKLFNQCTDYHQSYLLRKHTNEFQHWLSHFPYRGMLGGRVQLLPHQLYLVDEICRRVHPRVILADEVGLGKTVEAGLIIHRLLITKRAKKILIILPEALCFQWFFELYRKYNISFDVLSDQEGFSDTKVSTSNFTIMSTKYLCLNPEIINDLIANSYDLIVADEVHKIDQSEKNQELFNHLSQLTNAIKSVLFLSATPQMNGLKGHFERLQLIDANQFQSFEKFQEDVGQYINLSRIVKKLQNENSLSEEEITFLKDQHLPDEVIKSADFNKIIQEIVQTYGHGRVFFRNTRKSLEKINLNFPQRVIHTSPLEVKKDSFYSKDITFDEYDDPAFISKMEWLKELLEENSEQKFLLICRSKKLVINIENKLKRISSLKNIATFHSDHSLMARDRQAAYFADPQGAQILLCSEIGSEGRNFQFSSHLILFDLPLSPDKLEQRIGRLDRIGQKNNINIHIPFIKNSWEEVLYNYFHQTMSLFNHSVNGSNGFFELCSDKLNQMLENVACWLENDQAKLSVQLGKWKNEFIEFSQELEKGRDVLVELNSFNREKANLINFELANVDVSEKLQKFLEDVYTVFGVDVEELGDDIYYIKPGDNMFISSFPSLDSDGFSYTTNRALACENEEIQFMTWDHPLVVGIMEYILGEQVGNATIVTRKKEGKPKPFLEMNFKLQAMGPQEFEIEKYAPPLTKRLLLNLQGEDHTQKFPAEKIDQVVQDANPNIKTQLSGIERSSLANLISIGEKAVELWRKEQISGSLEIVETTINKEVKYLEHSQKKNNYVLTREIQLLNIRKDEIKLAIEESKVYLDSFRFIY
ncbi:RNA polymerase-associated protein RapA [Bacteriovoracaceae bacterium]|nr:RNA polymerase-associated protein RapA [Bacteriovoracaceae bacterium]